MSVVLARGLLSESLKSFCQPLSECVPHREQYCVLILYRGLEEPGKALRGMRPSTSEPRRRNKGEFSFTRFLPGQPRTISEVSLSRTDSPHGMVVVEKIGGRSIMYVSFLELLIK